MGAIIKFGTAAALPNFIKHDPTNNQLLELTDPSTYCMDAGLTEAAKDGIALLSVDETFKFKPDFMKRVQMLTEAQFL